MPAYAGAVSHLPWLLNLRDCLPGAARLSEKLLGLSARRNLLQNGVTGTQFCKVSGYADTEPMPDMPPSRLL